MKSKNYLNYKDVSITCACKAVYKTKSTRSYNVDICSNCHPFFTGKNKHLDTTRRIEKFQNKYKYKIKI